MITFSDKLKEAKWFIFLVFLCVVVFVLFYLACMEVKRNSIAEFNRQQMILADQAAAGITEFFNDLGMEFRFLVDIPDVADFNENGKTILVNYFNSKKPVLSSITRVDSNGRITWLAPYKKEMIGVDISFQKHIQELLKNRVPILSDVFPAVQGFRAIAYHYPIKKNGVYMGSIALLLNFNYISSRYLEKITIGDTGHAWMISREGTMIYVPVAGLTDKPIHETLKNYPDLISITEAMKNGEKGTGTYIFDRIKDRYTGPALKHVAYTPVNIMNTRWSIAVATSDDYITANIQGYRNKCIAIMLIFFGTAIAFVYFIRRNMVLSYEIEKTRDEVKTLKGFIPVCANCKKIRDDRGYWDQIEHYISEHADVQFSHGLCPECARQLYPDIKLDEEV